MTAVILSWLGIAITFVAYAKGMKWYDRANVCLWPLVAAAPFAAHVWSSVFISLAWGFVGAWHLLQEWWGNRLDRAVSWRSL